MPLKVCRQARFYKNKMHQSKVRSLTRSIMGLFTADKPNVTFLNRKDEYFKDYWFNKKLCDGVKLVAVIEHTSKKKAADMLMRACFSKYLGGKITEYIEEEKAARAENRKIKMTRFQMVLRRYARERGMDISKFI